MLGVIGADDAAADGARDERTERAVVRAALERHGLLVAGGAA